MSRTSFEPVHRSYSLAALSSSARPEPKCKVGNRFVSAWDFVTHPLSVFTHVKDARGSEDAQGSRDAVGIAKETTN
ncbi:MAG: hypothetical protein K9N55_19615 [Phycisphaerae bacterium]|nr:hypothetical protein [Phycisphaerae bacterium]